MAVNPGERANIRPARTQTGGSSPREATALTATAPRGLLARKGSDGGFWRLGLTLGILDEAVGGVSLAVHGDGRQPHLVRQGDAQVRQRVGHELALLGFVHRDLFRDDRLPQLRRGQHGLGRGQKQRRKTCETFTAPRLRRI